jgi:hypothetical protein
LHIYILGVLGRGEKREKGEGGRKEEGGERSFFFKIPKAQSVQFRSSLWGRDEGGGREEGERRGEQGRLEI